VATHPCPVAFPQVAGGARRAPASTTGCARTASAATPAPAPRATRERTVLSVRHRPLFREPVSSCRRGSLGSHMQSSHYTQLSLFRLKHTVFGRAGVMCVPCLLKHYRIPRLHWLPHPPKPPFSGDAEKGLEQAPVTSGLQRQPCPLPPMLPGCLSCCGAWRTRAAVPGCLPSHHGPSEATHPHETVPRDEGTPENKMFSVEV